MISLIKKCRFFLPKGLRDLLKNTVLMTFVCIVMFSFIYYPSLFFMDKLIDIGLISSKEQLFNSVLAFILLAGFIGVIVSVEATRGALVIGLQVISVLISAVVFIYLVQRLFLRNDPVVIIINSIA